MIEVLGLKSDLPSKMKDLLKIQSYYSGLFKESRLMKLLTDTAVNDKSVRQKLLDSIQLFSDYFQKAVMLRAIFTENKKYHVMAQYHLQEEFGHNTQLLADRKNRPPLFDPILESTACWFSWKMIALDSMAKTFIMHWVLEHSAFIFFVEAHNVMQKFGETDYFKTHAEADEAHQNIDYQLLLNVKDDDYQELEILLKQAWQILMTACDRIAELSLTENSVTFETDS